MNDSGCGCRTDDIEDYCLSADILERVRNGQERVYSAADVREELGLED